MSDKPKKRQLKPEVSFTPYGSVLAHAFGRQLLEPGSMDSFMQGRTLLGSGLYRVTPETREAMRGESPERKPQHGDIRLPADDRPKRKTLKGATR